MRNGRSMPADRLAGLLSAVRALAAAGVLSAMSWSVPAAVVVGSKGFTESVILGEIATLTARAGGVPVRHQAQLGGTRILWNALKAGEIDVYPEYTGTLSQEILGLDTDVDLAGLKSSVGEHGVSISQPLGFNNTYALGMRRDTAARREIHSISDLVAHAGLVYGFSNEFMDRADGWPGLKRHYRMPDATATGMDHDLAYRALAAGDLDVIDLYTTDAEIEYYDIAVLTDDRRYFPEYRAVYLVRTDTAARYPLLMRALDRLAGRIDNATMVAMNGRAKLQKSAEPEVAAGFLATIGIDVQPPAPSRWRAVLTHTREHLLLVSVSLGAAILISIPLGILAARRRRLGQVILGVCGLIQTIPALALLVFMIPVLGIGGPPALAALFLYSLLPIVRNTHAGLSGIPAALRESAEVLGLPSRERLRRVELPLAMRSILAGIKTSAVINVGTATLGALIGAGGYGQPILTGIRLDDVGLILQGALPAAGLALLVQGLFELAERYAVPRGLRIDTPGGESH